MCPTDDVIAHLTLMRGQTSTCSGSAAASTPLSQHVDQADIDSGRVPAGTPLDPGGNTRIAAQRSGIMPQSGNGLLQRIRKRLGPQAS
jgi:hypothetical protein